MTGIWVEEAGKLRVQVGGIKVDTKATRLVVDGRGNVYVGDGPRCDSNPDCSGDKPGDLALRPDDTLKEWGRGVGQCV